MFRAENKKVARTLIPSHTTVQYHGADVKIAALKFPALKFLASQVASVIDAHDRRARNNLSPAMQALSRLSAKTCSNT
jgi:hypothetical protein